ncbi:rhodanese-like domain-containing protein [Dolosicoccus paucivorans]|uniref:Rhodanese-like domain-containing protein n=1 Tax=Dolosicoccus paucivorans TaxID=84521 RepID=A0A1G8MXA2_9LACT|nr:rhodanese-like domain-containing protein [Dolosicoccus paucivorans]PMB84822.1 rhodanese-like domain-containing protein [Dolosicoccus paucivorans]PMC58536.1 rhodanese-like domain-containing protein [Dolosicoccus paucivorans]SDI71940.1 Rhodanese-related sulfurtransferase [Dolosicoccus paucivorans]
MISLDQLNQLLQQNKGVVLDVRRDDERARGAIPHSIHIPIAELADRYQELDPSLNYYVMCQSGKRAQRGVEFLKNKNYQVTCVIGDFNEWSGELI